MQKRRQASRHAGPIEKAILEELTGGDMLYGFLLSGRSTKRMFRLARERATHRYRRKLALLRLLSRGYVARRGDKISITDAGKVLIKERANSIRNTLKTKKWDGKWRIVAFDIPQKRAPLRRKVRSTLQLAGFVKLQQSVWIFPHECRSLIDLIKKESEASDYILYGILEQIESGSRLKKIFRL